MKNKHLCAKNIIEKHEPRDAATRDGWDYPAGEKASNLRGRGMFIVVSGNLVATQPIHPPCEKYFSEPCICMRYSIFPRYAYCIFHAVYTW